MSDSSPDLEAILVQHQWVRRLARQLVEDFHLAEDVAQSTFVAALERPPAHALNLRGWLGEVLRNTVRKTRRCDRRRLRREQSGLGDAPEPSSAELCERLQMHRAVVEAVDGLSEPYKTVVLMRYFDDLPPREIARRRSSPVATVNSQLARALQHLRQKLDERSGGDRDSWCVGLLGMLKNDGLSPVVTIGAMVMKTSLFVSVSLAAILCIWLAAETWFGAEVSIPAPEGGPTTVIAAEPVRSTPPERIAVVDNSSADQAGPPSAPEPTIRGRVIDVDSAAIADIALRWRDSAPAADPRPAFTTDASGCFELPSPERRRELVVDDEAWTTVLAGEVGPKAGEGSVEPVVVAAGRLQIAGSVVDEQGRPIADAKIQNHLPSGFLRRFSIPLDASEDIEWVAHSDDHGAFELDGIGRVDGSWVSVSKPGYVSAWIEQPESSRDDMAIELRRPPQGPGTLHGQVLDPAGIPVAEAWVYVGRAETVTDTVGMFAVPLTSAHGIREVVAMKRGYLPARHLLPPLRCAIEDDLPDFLYLQLGTECLHISGRVVDAAGNPLAGARVWVDDGSFAAFDEGYGTVEGYLGGGETDRELLAWAAANGRESKTLVELLQERPSALWGWVESDAAGHFDLGGLCDRTYRIKAMQFASLATVEVGAVAAGTTGVEIRFPADATFQRIAGVVVGLDGQPLPDVRVTAESTPVLVPHRDENWRVGLSVPCRGPSCTTDERGHFELLDIGVRHTRLSFSGDTIVTRTLGDARDGEPLALDGFPIDRLRVEVRRRAHLRVDLVDPDRATGFRVLDAAGRPAMVQVFTGPIHGMFSQVQIVDGRSAVCAVAEGISTVVLLKDGAEEARIPVNLVPGKVNVIDG